MPRPTFAHIVNDVAEHVGNRPVWAIAALALFALLSLQHLSVKHNGMPLRLVVHWLTIGIVVSVLAVVAVPSRTAAQDPQVSPGLPDLISDRPFIWFDKVIENPDGTLSRVLAFDGYLHNIGVGSLDLYGNPQIPGDVKQRVFDGESWENVSSPTVRYETTDGHNHFHLIGAVDYSLWDEGQLRKVDDGSKVGFCLVDTEQIEEAYPQFYDLMRFKYCNENEPDATELRMGITPGWRDTYDASITLQWVDVSAVQPGRYWVGAVTDPLGEIVESDEDNNALIYSMNTFPVPGFVPVGEHITGVHEVSGATTIDLPAFAIASVGLPMWTITTAPRHGRLDVPTGVAFNGGEIVYMPDADFAGEDSFEFSVRDSATLYPLRPQTHTVELSVLGSADADDQVAAPANEPPVTDQVERTIDVAEFVRVEEFFGGTDPDGDTLRWFGKNLPSGLRVDEATGTVTGVPTARGFYPSEIVAWDGQQVTAIDVTWNVAEAPADVNLWPRNELDLVVGQRLWVRLGRRTPGARYESQGMPDGVDVVNNNPRVEGKPTTVGTFDIVVHEIVDDVVTESVEFTWTVRPAAVPAFPL